MLYALLLLTFVSVAILGFMVIAIPATGERQVHKQLKHLSAYDVRGEDVDKDLSKSFAERVVRPILLSLARIAKRISPAGVVDHAKQQLLLAGNPKSLNVDKFLALRVIFGLAAVLLFLLVGMLQVGALASFIALLFIPIAYFLPDLWLRSVIEKRQKAIRLGLPDTLDMLTISVEAGLGFDSALSKVTRNSEGPLAEEFAKMLQETQVGVPRREAFRHLGQRTNVQELQSFVMAMVQADVFGISIGKVLRAQAKEMRTRRRQRAEEKAQKAPVKIIFPLILCIFPAIFVVIVGPAAIMIIRSVFSVL